MSERSEALEMDLLDRELRLVGTNEWNNEELLRLAGRYLQRAIFPVGFTPKTTRPEAPR